MKKGAWAFYTASGQLKTYDSATIPEIENICAGRLTLETAVPVSTTDQTAKTTIYFTPYKGTKISLYDGTRWKLNSLSEISVAVPSTLFRPFDVFIYNNAGTLTLETVDWSQTTGAITGATNASPIVITSTSHGLATGDVVGIASVGGNTAANGKLWTITVVNANSFSLDNSTGNGAYTSGGTWYKVNNSRATSLSLQNGVYVKTGDATRRYLGTGCTTGISGQCEDSLTSRLLWNYYNSQSRPMRVFESADSWTYSTATYRPSNNNVANRFVIIVGIAEKTIQIKAAALSSNTQNTTAGQTSIGKNSTNSIDTNVAGMQSSLPTTGNGYSHFAFLDSIPAIGLHFYQWLERSGGAATHTWFGDGGVNTLIQMGMTGTWEC